LALGDPQILTGSPPFPWLKLMSLCISNQTLFETSKALDGTWTSLMHPEGWLCY
jgi:hypothetical protein